LHDSLPSDPAEADLLKMAEAVADASDDVDCAASAVKKGLCHVVVQSLFQCAGSSQVLSGAHAVFRS